MDTSRGEGLWGAAAAGTVGLAGCLSFVPGVGGRSEYSCTAIDDEGTGRYEPGDGPIPFAFEYPSVMERHDSFGDGRRGRLEYGMGWQRPNPGAGWDVLRHSIRLLVAYAGQGAETKPMLFPNPEPNRGSVLGKRVIDGRPAALLQRDATETGVRLELWYPATVDGTPVYDEVTVEVETLLQGDRRLDSFNDPGVRTRRGFQVRFWNRSLKRARDGRNRVIESGVPPASSLS